MMVFYVKDFPLACTKCSEVLRSSGHNVATQLENNSTKGHFVGGHIKEDPWPVCSRDALVDLLHGEGLHRPGGGVEVVQLLPGQLCYTANVPAGQ